MSESRESNYELKQYIWLQGQESDILLKIKSHLDSTNKHHFLGICPSTLTIIPLAVQLCNQQNVFNERTLPSKSYPFFIV